MMKPSKILPGFLCIFFCVIIIAFADPIINFLGYSIQSEENTILTIHMEEGKNRSSYGREMRIVRILADGERVDLSAFANASWVWHEEWGYVLYQSGSDDFVVNFDKTVNELLIEYVKQDGSGNAIVQTNSGYSQRLRMYKKKWANRNLNISSISTARRVVICLELCLLVVFLAYILYRVLYYWKLKPDNLKKVRSSIGMFDFAKGVGIIGVIARHTIGLVASVTEISNDRYSIILSLLTVTAFYSVMPLFFFASGYGFRTGKIGTTVKRQLGYLLKPYLYVFAGVLISEVLQGIISGQLSLRGISYVLGGFLLANPHDSNIAGIDIGTIGPIWFTVVLCFSWIILNCILSIENKKLRYAGILGTVIIGGLLSANNVTYFCLTQSFAVVVYLFIGYETRVNKIYTRETWKTRIVYILLLMVFLITAVLNGIPFDIAYNQWGKNYFLATIAVISGSFVCMRGWLAIDSTSGKVGKLIKEIGCNSYYIFYIHAFEFLAIPWEKLIKLLPANKFVAFLIVFAARSLIIFLIYKVINVINAKKREPRRA